MVMTSSERARGGGVVVGFDDSSGSRRALRWAASEASILAQRLILVHAYGVPAVAAAYGWHPAAQLGDATREETIRGVMDSAAADTRLSHPDLDVSTAVVQDNPAESLLDIARQVDSTVIVVGSSGYSAVPRVLLGSTAADLVHATDRPVVVARGNKSGDSAFGDAVLAGLDGSRSTRRVLEAAFEYAANHGCSVQAVHSAPGSFLDDIGFGGGEEPALPAAPTPVESTERHIEEWHDRYPSVPVDLHVVDDLPAQALLEHTKDASLVVVGSRRHGPVHRAVLGSVSHAMLYHADCPVEVVPEALDRQDSKADSGYV